MQFRESVITEKESLVIKMIIIILATIALIAEILPELSAKLIVIPTLIVTIFICSIEIQKYISKHKVR